MAVPEAMTVQTLCNFVLDRHHSVLVGDVQCITLGHNFSHASVRHSVWGSDVIINFLKCEPGFPFVVSSAPVSVAHILHRSSVTP
jgi:hypothetical protein